MCFPGRDPGCLRVCLGSPGYPLNTQVSLIVVKNLKGFASLSEDPGCYVWASAQRLENSVPSHWKWGKDYGWNVNYITGTSLENVVK